jgi:hypothetical protein
MFATTPNEKSSDRPNITSYDTGYEHSVEHWFDLKEDVKDKVDEPETERPRAMVCKAGA